MKRYKHNLSHYNLLTCDMGKLIPINCLEVLPGDTFDHSTNLLIRVSPLTAPVMHPVEARIHHFYVPNRLVWDGWEDFITGGPDATDTSTPPVVNTSTSLEIFDYLYHVKVSGVAVSQLPLRAYNMIFNEYYRDQDLVDEVGEATKEIQDIAWGKDYFTSARPWPQKGDDVTLPVGAKAPVSGIGYASQSYPNNGATIYEGGGSTRTIGDYAQNNATTSDNTFLVEEDPDNPGFPNIYADLSAATAIPINDLRKAFALQRWQEARAKYGSRYVEYLRYCGVTSSDGRLDRPEYLGGGKTNINFSEVLQTERSNGTPASGDYSVGDMYGHGIAAMRSNRYRRFFEEHGMVISM